MTSSVESRLQSLDLKPFVSKHLKKSDIEVLDWQYKRLSAGGSEGSTGGLGIYRLMGTARDQDANYDWSMILKITSGSAQTGSHEPDAWNYWKREVLVYQSGLVANLPGSLVSPLCYGITEYPDDEYWMWLEDVREPLPEWTMAEHGLSARHLGEFNGAYLAGYPLPEAKNWLTWGRTREWVTFAQKLLEGNRQRADTVVVKHWFPKDSFERTYAVWANSQGLLDAFERLPVCFCHHDAFRRNLMIRPNDAGAPVTVAIDWAFTGFGRVGEEVGMTTANNLAWLDVPVSKAKELDKTIFAGYVEGLQAAGWKGDVRLARLGYLANAVLVIGLAWPTIMAHFESEEKEKWVQNMEKTYGRPLDELTDAWASTQSFLLDLADEAFALVDALDLQPL